MKIYVMISGYVWKLAVEMMVSAPIESEWMMTLSWEGCLDIRISAVLTACSSGNIIGLWFRILHLIYLSVSLMKHAQVVAQFACELASV